jgi:hypothetical protein
VDSRKGGLILWQHIGSGLAVDSILTGRYPCISNPTPKANTQRWQMVIDRISFRAHYPMEDLDQREIRRIDSRDLCGWASLLSAIFNVVYTTMHPLESLDVLASTSLVLAIISIINKNGLVPKLSIFITVMHWVVIFAIRFI